MATVFNLADVLKLIIDRFNNGALTQHQFIEERHQLVLHVLFQLRDEFDTLFKQIVKELLRDVSFIAAELAKEAFCQVPYRFTIV